jgi:hypothetical protein
VATVSGIVLVSDAAPGVPEEESDKTGCGGYNGVRPNVGVEGALVVGVFVPLLGGFMFVMM